MFIYSFKHRYKDVTYEVTAKSIEAAWYSLCSKACIGTIPHAEEFYYMHTATKLDKIAEAVYLKCRAENIEKDLRLTETEVAVKAMLEFSNQIIN